MAAANGGGTLLVMVANAVKEKMAVWIAATVISIVSFLGSYKLLGYRVEENTREIVVMRREMVSAPEQAARFEELKSFLALIRQDIRDESGERKAGDRQVEEDLRRANGRIDEILRELRYHNSKIH